MRPVYIVAAAVEPFGKHPDQTPVDLGGRCLQSLLRSASLAPANVDAGYVGSVYGGSLIAQRVMQRGAISGPPVFTVENACAGGGSAVHLAWQASRASAAGVGPVAGVAAACRCWCCRRPGVRAGVAVAATIWAGRDGP
jgi:acetyl-CoA acetyltransferase